MSEQPVVRDDSATEHPPPLELPQEPQDSARDAHDAVDDESHDPYQPL